MSVKCSSGGDMHDTCTSVRFDLAHRRNTFFELDQRWMREYVDIRIRLSHGTPRTPWPRIALRLFHLSMYGPPAAQTGAGGLWDMVSAPPVSNIPVRPPGCS